MPKVQIIGQILPMFANISVNSGVNVEWNDPDIGLEINFAVQIKNSVITVDCDINRFEDDDLTSLYMKEKGLSAVA